MFSNILTSGKESKRESLFFHKEYALWIFGRSVSAMFLNIFRFRNNGWLVLKCKYTIFLVWFFWTIYYWKIFLFWLRLWEQRLYSFCLIIKNFKNIWAFLFHNLSLLVTGWNFSFKLKLHINSTLNSKFGLCTKNSEIHLQILNLNSKFWLLTWNSEFKLWTLKIFFFVSIPSIYTPS